MMVVGRRAAPALSGWDRREELELHERVRVLAHAAGRPHSGELLEAFVRDAWRVAYVAPRRPPWARRIDDGWLADALAVVRLWLDARAEACGVVRDCCGEGSER